MSSEKTPNLQLNKWVPTDYVKMDEFNENFDKIDDKIGVLSKKVDGYASVKEFGAKGDGVADDTQAIQQALDSLQDGDTLFFPKGTYLITSTLVVNKRSIRLIGNSYGYYDMAELKGQTNGMWIIEVRNAGFVCEGLKLTGDGDLYGQNATVNGIKLIGAFTSNPNYDVDAIIYKCLFFKLNIAVQQKGKNVICELNNFSNCNIGIDVLGEGTPNDFRGLEVRNNRFHSLGSNVNTASRCIRISVLEAFSEGMMVGNYFDDCNTILDGASVGFLFSNNMITRCWGDAIKIDMTNAPVPPGHDKRKQMITNNIIASPSTTGIAVSAIQIIESSSESGRWIISNNEIGGFGKYGIYLSNIKRGKITDNYLDYIASDPSGQYDYIHLDVGCENVTIKNNILGISSLNTRYGINILSSTTNLNVMTDNEFYNFSPNKMVNIANPSTHSGAGSDGLGIRNIPKIKNNALGSSGIYTLKAGVDSPIQRQTAGLTGNVTVNFAIPNYDGAAFKIIRQGGGSYTFTVDAGAAGTRTLAAGEWIEVQWSQQAGAWLFTGKGQF